MLVLRECGPAVARSISLFHSHLSNSIYAFFSSGAIRRDQKEKTRKRTFFVGGGGSGGGDDNDVNAEYVLIFLGQPSSFLVRHSLIQPFDGKIGEPRQGPARKRAENSDPRIVPLARAW